MTLGAAAVKVEPANGKQMRGSKPEHKNSRATRRGPMDEMRQLIRILAKLMPHSEPLLRVGREDANGGNRVSEEQIRNYLAKSLGEAPQPEWGLPQVRLHKWRPRFCFHLHGTETKPHPRAMCRDGANTLQTCSTGRKEAQIQPRNKPGVVQSGEQEDLGRRFGVKCMDLVCILSAHSIAANQG